MLDGVGGLRLASSQTQRSSMREMTLWVGGGGFGVRPPAHIPNSSPSQARFEESTLMR
jgi:hypothetical protein